MFGKKKDDLLSKSEEKNLVEISTLPKEFYGGVNPVVTFKKVEKEVDMSKQSQLLSNYDKKLLEKETAAGGTNSLHPANLLSNKKFLFFGTLIVFLVIGLGGVLYYSFFYKKVPLPIKVPDLTVTSTPPDNIFPTTTTIENSTTTPTTSTLPQPGEKLEFPSLLLADSTDTDKDRLTDKEEEVFETDLGVDDSDDDGYTDAHEIFYLYNPAGKEPMRVIEAGTVQEFTNPTHGYKIYYPLTWKLGAVDSEYNDILLSTVTGEFIEIREVKKESNEDFLTWFGKWAPQEKYDQLIEFETYFKEKAWKRNDDLVYYFVTKNKVYVILYHEFNSSVINYRTTINMIARSFRFDPLEVGISTSTPLLQTTSTSFSSVMNTTTSNTSTPFSASSTPSVDNKSSSTIISTSTSL